MMYSTLYSLVKSRIPAFRAQAGTQYYRSCARQVLDKLETAVGYSIERWYDPLRHPQNMEVWRDT